MRELKFRAWDKEYNYMIEPDDIHPRVMYECITGDGKVLEVNESNSYMGTETTYEDITDKRILMQYVGIKDIHGKEVYEGDVLPYRNVVTYVDGSDSANLGMEVGFYAQRDNFESWRLLEVGEELEVLGNIYENPELLK
jgi:uncharacterized phage protein (TIGR01671 family)